MSDVFTPLDNDVFMGKKVLSVETFDAYRRVIFVLMDDNARITIVTVEISPAGLNMVKVKNL